ncbi:MAG: LPS export ABC transporter periplasmic protein LptC [Gammaproteobacteria bacterium]|nr:MAG: LPS export ABC transporter periplasmic protein LptC [Gammaproteobacteria bacterium]
MSYRLVWIFCLIVVGAALTLSFLNQRDSYTEIVSPSTSINTPTVSFENIEMIINSPAGQPQYELSAPKYWLYHDQQRSEFTSPDIVIYNENGSKIYATSEKGQTHDDNDVITLIGDVKIEQPSTNAEPVPLSIYTEMLTVSQKKQQVTTDMAVTATRGSQQVTALGMTMNLNDKVLHLHKNVKGQYNP